MTDQRLRDLLQDRVSDLDPDELGDLGGPAWARARRTRHRRAAAVGGGAVAAVLAVTAVAVLPGGGGDPAPPVQSPSATVPAGPAPQAVRSGEYGGFPAWWAPSVAEEADLPRLAGSRLPPVIDLSPDADPVPAGMRAVAAFQLMGTGDDVGRTLVVGRDGATYSLDTSRLEPVTDEPGNAYAPLGDRALAPDGRRLVFRQRSSLEVHDLETGRWTVIDTPDWLAEGARWTSATEIWVPAELGADAGPGTSYDVVTGASAATTPTPEPAWNLPEEHYGPLRETADGAAQMYFLKDTVRSPDGSLLGGVEAVVARTGEHTSLLVLPYVDRWKGCCPVAGWHDRMMVLFESRTHAGRILAWRVGTPQVLRVAEVTGWEPGVESYVASYADLQR